LTKSERKSGAPWNRSKLQLPIDKVYKFEEGGKAFEHMEANKHLGKIVVTL
jgi:NADPH2:quinone reductase